MTDQIAITQFNLTDFTASVWRDVALSEYLDEVPEAPAQGYFGQMFIHRHVTAGVMIAEAFRKACSALAPTPDTDGKTFYDRQFRNGALDPAAEGREDICNLAIDHLDVSLMSSPAWSANPKRWFGKDLPPEGQPSTALGRPLRPGLAESAAANAPSPV